MYLFFSNGNLMGETKQKMKAFLIRLDFQIQPNSKQQSRVVPSRSRSAIVCLYKMNQLPYLYSNFHGKIENLEMPKEYLCMTILSRRTFFLELQTAFFHEDEFDILDSFEM